ncbi:MAG: hypothetical protein LBU32_04050 [Clostridiales bacterium]|nr:hypothetical protein [Clostridiales bacterium]
MAGFAFEGSRRRTAYSRSMRGLSDALKSLALEAIKKKRGETGGPACIIIDDATDAVSKGRAKSGAFVEGVDRRCSHLDGATVLGIQMAAASAGRCHEVSAVALDEFMHNKNNGAENEGKKGEKAGKAEAGYETARIARMAADAGILAASMRIGRYLAFDRHSCPKRPF